MSSPLVFDVSDAGVGECRVRFVDAPASEDRVLMSFAHPATCYAVLSPGPAVEGDVASGKSDTLHIILLTSPETKQDFAAWSQKMSRPEAASPVYVKYRGVELLWRPGQSVLQCERDQAETLLSALIEFAHYEGELRRTEDEIAQAWPEAEQDNKLAFDVTPADLRRNEAIGERMERTLLRRIRHARVEPYLFAPDPKLSAAARKLGEELRERAHTEARAEIVDGQIEVFEHIYEMSSQRIGEYKASRQAHIVEWIIVLLLAAEALLMLMQTLLRPHN